MIVIHHHSPSVWEWTGINTPIQEHAWETARVSTILSSGNVIQGAWATAIEIT